MNRVVLAALIAVPLFAAALTFFPAPTMASGSAVQQPELSLITANPDEGFALAVTLSRRGVSTTQPDREVLQALRPEYANNAEALVPVSHVVAVHFQTIAAANDYWRGR
jgi:hypothetical protein